MTDYSTATEKTLACVVDVVAKYPAAPVDQVSVGKVMSRYGSIARTFSWTSVSQNRLHFYVQYTAATDCERARAADIPGLLASGIIRDPAHRTRFLSLIQSSIRPQSSSSTKAVRHVPYDPSHSPHAIRLRKDIPSSDDSTSAATGPYSGLPARPSFDYSRPPAKRPAVGSQAGPIRSQSSTVPNRTVVSVPVEPTFRNRPKEMPDLQHASSRDPPLSRADLPAHFTTPPNTHADIRLPLTPKSQTPSPPQPITVLPSKPKLDILLHGELVSLSAENGSAAQSIVAMLDADNASPDQWARTALQVAQQGYQATAEEIRRHAPPGPRGQETPSSQANVNVEEAIKQLAEIHAQRTKEGSRPDESKSSPLNHYAMDSRFDVKSHITSGRFLQADSTTPATPFKLNPLQAYFADVYSKLQTDLQASKEQCIQLEYNYELERALRKRVKADLRVETSLRKGCELQLKMAESQLYEERAKVAVLEAARHHDDQALDQARRELEETKELLGKIGLLVRSDKQAAIPTASRCI